MDPALVAVKDAPPLRGLDLSALRVAALGGISNRTLRLEGEGVDLVLRIPGATSATMIDRAQEAHNHGLAAAAHLAPPVLWADGEGRQLTPFLPHHRTPGAGEARDPETLARVGILLGALHRLPAPFIGLRTPEAIAARYTRLAQGEGVAFPPAFEPSRRAFETLVAALNRAPWPLAPAHSDPNLANILLADGGPEGEGDRLVDWEFSGVASPAWDLAQVSLDAAQVGVPGPPDEGRALDDGALTHLIEAWRGGPLTPADLPRVRIHEALVRHLWGLWALIRHGRGDPYLPWSIRCFEGVAREGGETRAQAFLAALGEGPRTQPTTEDPR